MAGDKNPPVAALQAGIFLDQDDHQTIPTVLGDDHGLSQGLE